MWELDHKEGWRPKNWCFQTVVLEKTLESPLDRKEIKSVNSKGNQPWMFTGRTDAEAETSNTFGHLMQRTDSLEKTWCWERLKAGGEGGDRGRDGWNASLTQWACFEHTLGDGRRTGKPGVLQSMESQRVRYDWTCSATEQQIEKEVRGSDDKKEQKYDKIQDKKY